MLPQPLGDRILVVPRVRPDQTESGLYLSGYLGPEVDGTVVRLGYGPRAEDGTPLDHYVRVGDRVLFPPEAGHETVINGARYIILREDDLLGILE